MTKRWPRWEATLLRFRDDAASTRAERRGELLELAQFLRAGGEPGHVERDLEQLFRRVAFNVAVGNRDDHLRNHGFLLGGNGWRLAPAFDVNPNIDQAEHVLNLDDSDNRPSLDVALSTAEFYGLEDDYL